MGSNFMASRYSFGNNRGKQVVGFGWDFSNGYPTDAELEQWKLDNPDWLSNTVRDMAERRTLIIRIKRLFKSFRRTGKDKAKWH
jgi:ribonuclease HII